MQLDSSLPLDVIIQRTISADACPARDNIRRGARAGAIFAGCMGIGIHPVVDPAGGGEGNADAMPEAS